MQQWRFFKIFSTTCSIRPFSDHIAVWGADGEHSSSWHCQVQAPTLWQTRMRGTVCACDPAVPWRMHTRLSAKTGAQLLALDDLSICSAAPHMQWGQWLTAPLHLSGAVFKQPPVWGEWKTDWMTNHINRNVAYFQFFRVHFLSHFFLSHLSYCFGPLLVLVSIKALAR